MPIPHGIDVCPFHFSLIGCFGLLRSIASSWRFRRRSYRHESSESVRDADSRKVKFWQTAVGTRRRQQAIHRPCNSSKEPTDRDLSPTSHTSLGLSQSLRAQNVCV